MCLYVLESCWLGLQCPGGLDSWSFATLPNETRSPVNDNSSKGEEMLRACTVDQTFSSLKWGAGIRPRLQLP
jgi:hypothetical protein